MDKKQKWIFWQVVPSPHLAPFFRELARKLGSEGEVICIFECPVPQERLNLGWALPDYGGVKTIIAPTEVEVERLVETGSSAAFHFFSGLISSRWLRTVYRRCLNLVSFLGIITEARNSYGFQGLLRRAHSLWIEREWRGNVDLAFAMGGEGVRWLGSVGYSPLTTFPFGYVVETPTSNKPPSSSRRNVHFAFVGKLEQRKFTELLVKAFLRSEFENCALTIVGDGPERVTLERLVTGSDWRRNVAFRGALPNAEVRQVLADSDCLVLPSKYDGWGAVVNEAMLAGTRVIVSDRCGAADVVESGYNGFIFKSGDIGSLVSAMTRIRDMGPIDPVSRQDLIRAAAVLSPASLVEYFLNVVEYAESGYRGERPKPPWEGRLKQRSALSELAANQTRDWSR